MGHVKIMIATNAFRMSIDKKYVRFVIHTALMDNINTYMQQVGRAGRNGLPAKCFLYYHYKTSRGTTFDDKNNIYISIFDMKF